MSPEEDEMEQQMKEQMAMFRFGVIASLVSRRNLSWGEREAMIKDITEKQWDIPGCGRSRIGRSTVLRWLDLYQKSGQKVDSLRPHGRKDKGRCRCLDEDSEQALLELRKEMPEATLPVLLVIARDRKIRLSDGIYG
jgi:putative transposase